MEHNSMQDPLLVRLLTTFYVSNTTSAKNNPAVRLCHVDYAEYIIGCSSVSYIPVVPNIYGT